MNPNELIRVILPRKGEILLLPRDHLATGGEGAVYLKDGLVFKLYLDSAGARARGMEEKIRLLSKFAILLSLPPSISCATGNTGWSGFAWRRPRACRW